MTMIKRRINKRYLIFSAITFVIFLVLIECGIRTFFWVKNRIDVRERNFQEYLGWETAANLSKTNEVKGYGEITYSTGNYGFRRFGDPETDKIKLFVIGDSFTAGNTVSDGETYYDYLQHNDDRIVVFAYGGGGYGSLQEFMILDRYFDEIRPDVVLWQFCSNDFINNCHELESASLFNNNQMTRPYYRDGHIEWLFPKQYGGWFDKLIQSSYLLRIFNIRLNILAGEKRGSIEWELSPEHPLFQKSAKITSDVIGFVRERIGDIPMLAFSVDEPTWTGRTFQDICKEHSIDFVEGIPEAIEEAKKAGVVVDGLPYDAHWNGRGHAIAGEIILRRLNDKGHLHKREGSIPGRYAASPDLLKKYGPPSDDSIPVRNLSVLNLTHRNSNGFGELEGPYPEWKMPRKVRWMVSTEASVSLGGRVKKNATFRLDIRVLSQAIPQSFKILLNADTILEETIDSANDWRALTAQNLKLKEGINVLRFRASKFNRYPADGRDLYVLFDELEFKIE